MSGRGRLAKLVLLVALIICCGIGIALLQVPGWVRGRVLAELSNGCGIPVAVRSMQFEWPDVVQLEGITLGSAATPVGQASRARLQIDWSATVAARALRFARVNLQTPVLTLPLPAEAATAYPDFLQPRPVPWQEMIIADGMLTCTMDSLALRYQNVVLTATEWSDLPAQVAARGLLTADWRAYHAGGETRLELTRTDGRWQVRLTTAAADLRAEERVLQAAHLTLDWLSGDSAVQVRLADLVQEPLRVTEVEGTVTATDTGFAGDVRAGGCDVSGATLGRLQALWQWQPGERLALAPLRLEQGNGAWEGSWTHAAADSPAASRLLLTGHGVELATLLRQVAPLPEGAVAGTVDATVRATITGWGATRTLEGEARWAGDSLTLAFPAAWENFNALWTELPPRTFAAAACAGELKATPRFLRLAVQARNPNLIIVATGQRSAAGNLDVEVTALPLRAGAARIAEHSGLDLPPGRAVAARWQALGSVESPRWEWRNPLPVDTVTDAEPYLLAPAQQEQWEGEWLRLVAPLPAAKER